MYIEILDNTGKVSDDMQQETVKLLNFAANFIHLPEHKEMAITYVLNDEIQKKTTTIEAKMHQQMWSV